jgi:hypothetical protein
MMIKRYIVAFFKDEGSILKAVKGLRTQKIAIYDTYTPYAIHGMDDAMGVKPTRLPWVTVLAGLLGCTLALLLQFWTSAIDWPVNVGGKPDNSWPAYIPVTFEITVLFGGLISVAAFFFRDKLCWGNKPRMKLEGVTDDLFAIVIERSSADFDREALEAQLMEEGASHIEEKLL